MSATIWLLSILVLRPVHAERHPSVEFPSLDSCWRKAVLVIEEEAREGNIAGFTCKPSKPRYPIPYPVINYRN